ncbi:MAG: hypothetical protein OEW93_10350 [Candidatus Bathyarchaeota archaeon]|nr:hypothetical protein [Candidatus Bathyarchaeota archaeon]MDH5791696.1 hypothetical protein [Candidatus Bathyarchaeota archaeon]
MRRCSTEHWFPPGVPRSGVRRRLRLELVYPVLLVAGTSAGAHIWTVPG